MLNFLAIFKINKTYISRSPNDDDGVYFILWSGGRSALIVIYNKTVLLTDYVFCACFLCVRLSDHSSTPRWTATLITSQLQNQRLQAPPSPNSQLPAPTVYLCGCQSYLGSSVYSLAGGSHGYLCAGGLRRWRVNTKWMKRKQHWRELACSTELQLLCHWLRKTCICFFDCHT